MASRPDWGRGRIDPFNPVKVNVLKMPRDDTIGNADMPPIWNLKAHEGFAFHWDGMNSKIHDIVLSSAIGDGATRDSIDLPGMQASSGLHRSGRRPKYPFPIRHRQGGKGPAHLRPKMRRVPCVRRHADRQGSHGRRSRHRRRAPPPLDR